MTATLRDTWCPPGALPRFDVAITSPNLKPWRAGNTGTAGFWRFDATTPGPHAVITALIHGNEIAGACVLADLLTRGVRPLRGSLTLGFCNLTAFDRFDPANPTATRFVDEDMNRVWDETLLASPRQSTELTRARAIQPLIADADALLDLHSMLWPSDPLLLCGPTQRGARLAASIGTPTLVVADHGHAAGRRLIDYAPFTTPNSPRTAILAEAGQHWQPTTITAMAACVDGFLASLGMAPAIPKPTQSRMAEVTTVITAQTGGFAFLRAFRGGEIIADSGTLIALDGAREIRTPHNNCLLIMPSLKPSRGHTAVRLAKFVD